MFVAIVHFVANFFLSEDAKKPASKLLNIGCNLFCYAVLARYVYNHIIADFFLMINL